MVYFLYFLIGALFLASHDKIMDFDFTFWGNSARKAYLRAGGMPNPLSIDGRECAQNCIQYKLFQKENMSSINITILFFKSAE